MQNLYMMATMVREDQLRKMAIEINSGTITIEQAMENYNVSEAQYVKDRVRLFKEEIRRQSERNHSERVDLSVLAA